MRQGGHTGITRSSRCPWASGSTITFIVVREVWHSWVARSIGCPGSVRDTVGFFIAGKIWMCWVVRARGSIGLLWHTVSLVVVWQAWLAGVVDLLRSIILLWSSVSLAVVLLRLMKRVEGSFGHKRSSIWDSRRLAVFGEQVVGRWLHRVVVQTRITLGGLEEGKSVGGTSDGGQYDVERSHIHNKVKLLFMLCSSI